MKIIPFADHTIGWRCTKILLEQHRLGNVEIPLVLTTKGNNQGWWPPIANLLEGSGISLAHFEDICAEDVRLHEPNYVLLLSWKYLLSEAFLRSPNIHFINLHYSLLPKFRGVYPVNWAIMEGESETGVSFHLVTPGVDSGPILKQRSVRIDISDTSRSLIEKLDITAEELFRELLTELISGHPPAGVSQEPNADYFSRKRFDAVRHIDLSADPHFRKAFNLMRGLTFDPSQPLLTVEENGKRFGVSIIVQELSKEEAQ